MGKGLECQTFAELKTQVARPRWRTCLIFPRDLVLTISIVGYILVSVSYAKIKKKISRTYAILCRPRIPLHAI